MGDGKGGENTKEPNMYRYQLERKKRYIIPREFFFVQIRWPNLLKKIQIEELKSSPNSIMASLNIVESDILSLNGKVAVITDMNGETKLSSPIFSSP